MPALKVVTNTASTDSQSLKFKVEITKETPAANNTKNVEMAVSLN